MQQIIHKFSQNPGKLFLIDALGAFLPAFCLIAMLTIFQLHFRMPSSTLIVLIVIALLFCGFSTCCFFFVKSGWRPFLKAISWANVLYCCLTAGFIVYHFQELTVLGIVYFLIEIMIIGVLAFIEKGISNFHNFVSGQQFEIEDEVVTKLKKL